jgi:hypothetical protein
VPGPSIGVLPDGTQRYYPHRGAPADGSLAVSQTPAAFSFEGDDVAGAAFAQSGDWATKGFAFGFWDAGAVVLPDGTQWSLSQVDFNRSTHGGRRGVEGSPL